MDTKKLEALITVIKHGSLTSASEALGYTQPGLTNMMNSIEDELGFPILIRSKSGVRLSSSGQELFPYIRELLDTTNKFQNAAEIIRNKSFSSLKIGAYSSITRQWLPSIMLEFISAVPDVDLAASMQDIKTMYNAVKNEQLDCAIVSYSESLLPGLSWVPLANDEFVAVIPNNEYRGESSFQMSAFEGKLFLMPSGGFDLDIIPLFNNTYTPANIRYTNMDDATIVSMVEHGLGVTIMSRLIMDGIRANVTILPLHPSDFRKLGIIVKEKRVNEKAIQAFISAAKNVVSQL